MFCFCLPQTPPAITPTQSSLMPSLEESILEFRRSLTLKPKKFRLALQCPPAFFWGKQGQLRNMDRPLQDGITAHGMFPIGINIPVLGQEALGHQITQFEELCAGMTDEQKEMLLRYWPDLNEARSLDKAQKFHLYQASKHALPYNVPPALFIQLPLHFVKNLPKDFGIYDNPQPRLTIRGALQAAVQSNAHLLTIGNVFQIDSDDLEICIHKLEQKHKDGTTSITYIVKEVRFWVDGRFSRTISIPEESRFTGAHMEYDDMLVMTSKYPEWVV